MNLLEKLICYINLKRKHVRHAFCTAFCNNKLTPLDCYFIILVITLILACVTLHFADSINNAFTESEKRAQTALKLKTDAFKQLNQREYIIAHMLNGNYVRLDGVKRKVKLCDSAGVCE